MSKTRNASYRELKSSGGLHALDAQVLASITGQPATRQEIAETNDLKLASVCGAVRRLLDAKLIVEIGDRKNPETGKRNAVLAAYQAHQATQSTEVA